MVGLGSDEWYLPAARPPDALLRIRITYDEAAADAKLKDFQPPMSNYVARSQSILVFVNQFRSLRDKWMNSYEDFTYQFLGLCVDYQEDLLRVASPSPEDLSTTTTIITSALRALMFSQDIFMVRSRFEHNTFKSGETSYEKREPPCAQEPLCEIWHLPSASELLTSRVARPGDVNLYALLREIMHKVHHMLMEPISKPKDWPALLYVLCMLHLVALNLVGRSFLVSIIDTGV